MYSFVLSDLHVDVERDAKEVSGNNYRQVLMMSIEGLVRFNEQALECIHDL